MLIRKIKTVQTFKINRILSLKLAQIDVTCWSEGVEAVEKHVRRGFCFK